jgi:hypothetical protein
VEACSARAIKTLKTNAPVSINKYPVETPQRLLLVHAWQETPAMKTVNIPTQAKTVTSLLKKAQREGLILRSPEGQEFILAEIDDFNREIELSRQNRALMKFLNGRGKQTQTVKAADVKKQLDLN